jgi:hypothetical protein
MALTPSEAYNETRPHSTFNGQTPSEAYNEVLALKDNFPLMLKAA